MKSSLFLSRRYSCILPPKLPIFHLQEHKKQSLVKQKGLACIVYLWRKKIENMNKLF